MSSSSSLTLLCRRVATQKKNNNNKEAALQNYNDRQVMATYSSFYDCLRNQGTIIQLLNFLNLEIMTKNSLQIQHPVYVDCYLFNPMREIVSDFDIAPIIEHNVFYACIYIRCEDSFLDNNMPWLTLSTSHKKTCEAESDKSIHVFLLHKRVLYLFFNQ